MSPFYFSVTSTYECLRGPGHHKGTRSPRSRGPAMSLDNIPRRPTHGETQHTASWSGWDFILTAWKYVLTILLWKNDLTRVLHQIDGRNPDVNSKQPLERGEPIPVAWAEKRTLIFLMASTCTESLSSILSMVSSILMWYRCLSMNFFSSSIRSCFCTRQNQPRQNASFTFKCRVAVA